MSDAKAKVDEILAAAGITYSAVFVPKSLSRNAAEKDPSLNWKVSITRGKRTLTTDYMQGIGHLPDYDKLRAKLQIVVVDDYIQDCAETGMCARSMSDAFTYKGRRGLGGSL